VPKLFERYETIEHRTKRMTDAGNGMVIHQRLAMSLRRVRITKILGRQVRKEILETEVVPAGVDLAPGTLETSDWKSRFA
jgi:hypothetical protein